MLHAQIPGTKGVVGTSNIAEHSLPFDLSIFKSVLQIEVGEIMFFLESDKLLLSVKSFSMFI